MKLELLTNATVVGDAIRFLFQKSNEKQKTSSYEFNEDRMGICRHNEEKRK